MYPDTKVVSSNTGYDRNYTASPYDNYQGEELVYFPLSNTDNRLFSKEIVHGIITNDKAKVYWFEHF